MTFRTHLQIAFRWGGCPVSEAGIGGRVGAWAGSTRACKRLIVSAEEIVENDEIRRYPDRTTIPYYLVDAVVHAPFGSFPGEMPYLYARDDGILREWVEGSKTTEGSQAYLEKYIHSVIDHKAYLDLIGPELLGLAKDRREVR